MINKLDKMKPIGHMLNSIHFRCEFHIFYLKTSNLQDLNQNLQLSFP